MPRTQARIKRRNDRPYLLTFPDGSVRAHIPGKVTARKLKDVQFLLDAHAASLRQQLAERMA